MAFWNLSPTPPKKKTHRQQLEEYALENKDKPFIRGLLLCSLAQIEASDWEREHPYKDVDDAILNSAVTMAWDITCMAMKANGLMWLLTRGVIIRQPKVQAILMFNLYVQLCLLSILKEAGIVIDPFRFNALTLRSLFVALPEEEWDRVNPDLGKLSSETAKEICREDEPNRTKWKEQMHTYVPAYILSFIKDSPQLQIVNYPWVFDQLLRMLLQASEG